MAFVDPNEADVKPQFATELTRARRLVSPEFVDKMKEKFKQAALGRIQAEKEVVFFSIIPTDKRQTLISVHRRYHRGRGLSNMLRCHDGCGHHSLHPYVLPWLYW